MSLKVYQKFKPECIKRLAKGYLCAGFAVSLYQNLFGELTAFAWTGSIKGNLLLLFWWFIVPAVIWPWDLFWFLFHLIASNLPR